MFSKMEMAPPDAILGLTEAFKSDPNPDKINLGVGVYKDAGGKTPVLASVKEAERRLLESEDTKSYLPIPGDPAYGKLVRALLFGEGHDLVNSESAKSAHTPGGTGALRVAADFIKQGMPGATVWVSNPTWANHQAIFEAAGLPVREYPYYDQERRMLDIDSMLSALQKVPATDVVLLHGCCHNPSGMDPDGAQWLALADVAKAQGFLPLLDFAYQGFAEGIDEDAASVRAFCKPGIEFLVCSSFSKNFGLYRERTGALTLVAHDADGAAKAFSQMQKRIRANYSNPPAHGGLIVKTILEDTGLRAQWEQDVAAMRDRINAMRHRFVETLAAKGVQRDFSFIEQQRGMFSFSGLTKEQVAKLKSDYSIYMVGSGRINVAGMTEGNLDRLCNAIKAVL
ncbi:amino acid aminotransferase [Roseovarius pacificus]|uniref:amino acid aminotransferase n=1 Tax=Roseovarius pacificus TaxID=337701 RepID=UPI002A18804B|nr:amino acid aminotransferase [Roseovarius pacificus]